MGQPSKAVVGSKVGVLTAEVVYNVAHGRCTVELDSSSLENIASKKLSSVSILPRPADTPVDLKSTQLLRNEEVRATLVVLLHKLLRGPPIRTFLPIFIREVLNLGLTLNIPASNADSAVIRAFVANIYDVRKDIDALGAAPLLDEAGKDETTVKEFSSTAPLERPVVLNSLKNALEKCKAGEIGVTRHEVAALESSFAASTGIAALSFYSLNSLVVLADAVAALSCEALLADAEVFKPEYFKQEFSRKSEADVANDLNSLLFGSKLCKASNGGLDAEYISNVPAAHGALRDAMNVLAPRLRVDINRVEIINKTKASLPPSSPDSALASSSGTSSVSSSLFTSSMLSLLISLRPTISGSFERTSKCVEFVRTLGSESDVSGCKTVEDDTDEITSLKRGLPETAARAAVSGDENTVYLSRETLSTTETWTRVLAKESVAALALLSIRERLSGGRRQGQDVEQSRVREDSRGGVGVNGAGTRLNAPVGKPVKSKNNFVLGKGTDVVRSSLAGYLSTCSVEISSTLELFSNVDKLLQLFLNFQIPELQALFMNVRSVLESTETRRLPKIAKGTRDFKPEQMVIREKAFSIISAIFKRHGAGQLDTPVFELKETLMGKYGEDSKLIYDLADQGGEILSLRYDLTVPFARYLATNKVENMKRYHIARVYRRDNPAKGRYREFYQCDFDIAGQYPLMIADFEVLKVVTELLDELDIGQYEVKLNHRKLLDGMLQICGVPQSKFRSICSAIDKLDKLSWDQVRKEMVEEKGLAPEIADKIGGLVYKRGHPLILLEELKQIGSPFLEDPSATTALEELAVLFKYLKASKCIDRIVFDLSLARGLDYYTGVIYEATFKGSTQVGSIAAGGRYDNLVGMFSGKPVPAVGVSLGIERVFAIMEKQEEDRKRVVRCNQTEVLVVVLGKDEKWTEIAIEMVTDLWEGRLKAEFSCVAVGKMGQQITKAATSGIPWLVIAGEDELKAGIVRLRDISASKQEDVRRDSLVAELQRRVGIF